MSAPEPAFFDCHDLHVSYDGDEVLHGVSLRIAAGEMVGIIGPNGSGKSTLLRALSGTMPLDAGGVNLLGESVFHMRARKRAQILAVVQQQSGAVFAFSVWDMVAMGRHPHLSPLGGLGPEDRDAVLWALERTDCMQLRTRLVTELSGGELQRVIIARALAQGPQALLLDEPTNHLDINHQLEIGTLVRSLNMDRGMTVVWVSHDVNLAAEFCDRIVMLADGRIVGDGPPVQVITEERISGLYGTHVPVLENPLTGRPQVVLTAGTGER